MKTIFNVFKIFKYKSIILFLIIFISAGLEVFGLGMILPILELISGNESSQSIINKLNPLLSNFDEDNHLLILLTAFGIVMLSKSAFTIIREGYKYYYVFIYRQFWQNNIFDSYLHSQINSLRKNKHGILMNNIITEPINAGKAMLSIVEFVVKIVISIFLFGLLLWANVTATVIMTSIVLVLMFIVNKFSHKYSTTVGHIRVDLNQQISNLVSENLLGIQQNKLYQREIFVKRIFKQILRKYSNLMVKFNVIKQLPWPLAETLGVIGVVSSILYLHYGLKLDLKEYIPIIALYIIVANKLIPNVSQVVSQKMHIHTNVPSLQLMINILKNDMNPERKGGDEFDGVIKDEIKFQNISFSHDEKRKLFDHINLNFKKGICTALIGASGSGKTTVVDLISQFLIPQDGIVSIDNENIQKYDLKSWRRSIGYVNQLPFIFNGTIRENITMGRDVKNDAFKNLINKSALDEFIKELPEGLETHIENNGENLSGGQRQRIAIARSLVSDPKILILDEITSALDIKSEQLIKAAIDDLKKDRIIILITHKMETAEIADYFYILKDGKVTEHGEKKVLVNFQKIIESS